MRSEEWWNVRTTYKAPQYPFLYGKQLTVSSRQIKYLFTANRLLLTIKSASI